MLLGNREQLNYTWCYTLTSQSELRMMHWCGLLFYLKGWWWNSSLVSMAVLCRRKIVKTHIPARCWTSQRQVSSSLMSPWPRMFLNSQQAVSWGLYNVALLQFVRYDSHHTVFVFKKVCFCLVSSVRYWTCSFHSPPPQTWISQYVASVCTRILFLIGSMFWLPADFSGTSRYNIVIPASVLHFHDLSTSSSSSSVRGRVHLKLKI